MKTSYLLKTLADRSKNYVIYREKINEGDKYENLHIVTDDSNGSCVEFSFIVSLKNENESHLVEVSKLVKPVDLEDFVANLCNQFLDGTSFLSDMKIYMNYDDINDKLRELD